MKGDLIGAGQRFVNAGATRHEGFEVSGRLDLGTVTGSRHNPFLKLAYTGLTRAEFASDQLSSVDGETPVRGQRLPYAPRHLLGATAGLAHASGLQLRLQANRVSDQFTDDLNTVASSEDGQRGVIPAYVVVHGSISYAFEPAGVTLFLSGKNLLDRVYITERQHGIMVGMPRVLTAGATWAF